MKKHRRGKVTRKSSRVMALLFVLLMITALIVPIGAKAAETADGSASGASAAVAEESHEKEEKKTLEKEEEKDSSVSDEKKEESAKDASSEEKTSESEKSEQKDNMSDASADTSSEEKSEKSKSSDDSASDAGKNKNTSGSSDKSSSDKDVENTSEVEKNKNTSTEDTKDDQEQSGGADTGDSAATPSSDVADSSSSDAAGASDTTFDKSEKDQGAHSDQDTVEETAKVTQISDTTITFRSREVTVVADRKAFDTEVTMKVKKVTDPEQLLKMVTALNEEGGSYTVKAYNVSFYDQKGNEVEPGIPVQVNVNTKVSSPSKSKVVHVKDNDKTEILDEDVDRSGASFEIDSFSDIGVATEAKTKIPGSSFNVYLGEERSEEYTVDDLPAGPISEEDLPSVEGYIYKNATAGDDTVEEIGTITDAEGKVYVYYTTKDSHGTLTAEILGQGRIRINLVETEKDTIYDLDADGAHVHIEAPADAFDEGTYMEISRVELTDAQQVQVREEAAEKLGEDAELNIQAVDITFLDKDNHKVQPEDPVRVELTTPQAVEGNFCVVHLGDDDTADRVEASRNDEGSICFTARRFSVYAVVGDDLVLEESRMTLNFYNGDELIGTMFVKNDDDTIEELEQIIYDPGAGELETGELFKGWIEKEAYEVEDEADKMDIAAIRTWAKGKANADSIEEGEEHNYYAMIFKTFSVVFKDEDGAAIHSEALIFKSSDGSVDYTINQPYTPKDQDEAFQGWYWQTSDPDSTVSDAVVAKDGSEQPFPNETEVTIKDNITFTVNVPRGYWLSFKENGEGASYTPPQFIQTGEKPQEPNDPTRFGYQFGGWYEDAACEGQPFDFDAGDGTNPPNDILEYLDNSGVTAGAASTPNDTENKQFMYWVVQTWNGTAYVDTDKTVYSGVIFTVLKANSKVLVTEWVNPDDEADVITVVDPSPGITPPDSTHTKIKTASYTVQLRAEYGDKEGPTPTHIWWFPNNVEAGTSHSAVRADEELKINEAVNILAPPTRSGYIFLGWAKVESEDSESSREGTAMPTGKALDLTENDLFLKYENGAFQAQINGVWTTVTQVAADEQSPYHDLYAVWEKTTVDIVVNKLVTGNMGDTSKAFTFEAVMADGSAFADREEGSKVTLSPDKKTASFSLKDGESVTITGLPSTASMTITETNAGDYDTSAGGISGGSLEDKTYSFTIPDEDGEVTFSNDKTAVAPTQLYSGTGPMAVLVVFSLGVLILLAAHHFIDRFRNNNNM